MKINCSVQTARSAPMDGFVEDKAKAYQITAADVYKTGRSDKVISKNKSVGVQ